MFSITLYHIIMQNKRRAPLPFSAVFTFFGTLEFLVSVSFSGLRFFPFLDGISGFSWISHLPSPSYWRLSLNHLIKYISIS